MNRMLTKRTAIPKQDSSRSPDELSDETLLDRFLSGEPSESEEAFRALVVRHGPMVLGVCRHVLNQHHDAEDAFQATFLALARKGGAIRDRRVLAGWLHEVAFRLAVKARASANQRRARERDGMAMSAHAIEPDSQDQVAAWNELRPVLHAEVDRLPERYRIPVILSYLEGKTNEEVAALLEWPVGTVKGRLSRARDLLRSRLMRRGLSLSAAFLVTAISKGSVFAEVVPTDLIERTTSVASALRFDPAASHPDSSMGEPSIERTINTGSARTDGGFLKRLKFVRPAVVLLVFSILSLWMSIGICLAVSEPGNSLGFRRVLAALHLAPFGDNEAPCH